MSNRQHFFIWALDKKAGVDVIYFDLMKAFDCIPHPKLLQKLNELDIFIAEYRASSPKGCIM